MGFFNFFGKGGSKSGTDEGNVDLSELQGRWLRDIETCCFSDSERDGLYFFMGLVGELYLKEEDLGDSFIEGYVGLSVGMDDQYEPPHLDCSGIRSALYTTAVILQEKWGQSGRPLSNDVNVGAGYMFEGILDQRIYDQFEGLEFRGKNVDELFLAMFESFGKCLSSNNIKGFKDCLRVGNHHRSAYFLDDARSTVYVLEKLRAVMPPLFEALLNYPILYASDVVAFKGNELFSMVLNHSLKGEQNEVIKRVVHRWHQYVFYDDKDTLNPFWDFTEEKHFSTLGSIALNGSSLKRHLSPTDYTKFLKNPNALKTDLGGKVISVRQYLAGIAQIVELKYSYTLAEPNWKNHGLYLQVICFFYYEACLYSIFPESVKG